MTMVCSIKQTKGFVCVLGKEWEALATQHIALKLISTPNFGKTVFFFSLKR